MIQAFDLYKYRIHLVLGQAGGIFFPCGQQKKLTKSFSKITQTRVPKQIPSGEEFVFTFTTLCWKGFYCKAQGKLILLAPMLLLF